MGKVYECIGRKATKPFFLEKICCNVFSAEELVYCVYENAELLEKEIFTAELANWLEDECGAGKMAEKLYQLLRKDAEVSEFAQVLLEAFPFVGEGARNRFLDLLKDEQEGNGKSKKRADYFLQKGRYIHALNEYESVLAKTAEEDVFLKGDIYHNMGLARIGLFLLEQAAEDFMKAYELDGKEEHYYCYAAAKRFLMSESEYIRTISEDVQMREVTLKLEEKMQEATIKWQQGPGAELLEEQSKHKAEGSRDYEHWVNQTILKLKDDYRRCIQ